MTSPPQALASVAKFEDTDEVLPVKSQEAFATVVGRSPRHSRRRSSVHGVEANKRQRIIKPGTFQSLVEHAIGIVKSQLETFAGDKSQGQEQDRNKRCFIGNKEKLFWNWGN